MTPRRSSGGGLAKLFGALLLSAHGLPQKQPTDAAGRFLRPSPQEAAPQHVELRTVPLADLHSVAGRQVPHGDYARPVPPRGAAAASVEDVGTEAVAAAGGGEAAPAKEGQAEAEAGESGDKVTNAERAYSFSLIGGVVTVMALFYLVNWDDEDIRLNTWQTLSMTVSIFGSVLIYGSVKAAIQDSFGIFSGEGVTYLNMVIFVVCLIGLQVLLYFLAGFHSKVLLPSVGTIFAHLTGFAAMYCGAGFQAVDGIRDSSVNLLVVTLAIAAFLAVVTLAGAKAREYAASRDGSISECDERWMEQVEDVENDILSLCLGFAVMQIIRFFISGKLRAYEPNDAPEDIQQWEANALWAGGFGMGLLTCLGSFAVTQTNAEARLSGSARRLFTAYRNVSSMSMAWCFLFWAEWQIYALGYKGIRIGACLAIALLVTVASAVAILGLDLVADELARTNRNPQALRSLILSLALAVGFTWERAFDMGLDKFSLYHFGSYHAWLKHVPPLVLSAVVLPAWSWYILPNTLKKPEAKS